MTIHLASLRLNRLRPLALAFAAPILLAQSAAPPAPAAPSSASADPPSAPAATLSAPTKPIDFDVATFKLNKSGDYDRKLGFTGDGFVMQNRPFHDLIRYAFAKTRGGSFQLSGQPSWVDDDHYDVQARVAPEDLDEWKKLNAAGQKVALQGFIVEYLKLKYHPDTTPHAYYALVVAKNGLKMKPYKPGDTFKTPTGEVVSGTGILQWVSGSEVIGQSIAMPRLADQLAGHADKGILDQTGLTGPFNFDLRFDDMPDPSGNFTRPFLAMAPGDATPAIFSAVKQLGLELKPATGTMDGIVVDHIERPPED
jgi:uncharacterized protein (TIGR03435 family)